MNNQVQELKSIITRLEQVVTSMGGSTSTGQTTTGGYPPLTEFRHVVDEFRQASESVTEPNLKDITAVVLRVYEQMEAVVAASTHTKKPNQDQFKTLQKAVLDNVNKVAKFSTNQAVQPHVKVVLDGINSVFWVVSDTPSFVFDGAIEPAEYNGLKVKQQKVPENSKWYDLFIKSLKTLQQYVVANFKMGLDWNTKGTATFDDLLANVKAEKPTQTASAPKLPPPPPPVSQLAPATHGNVESKGGALFAEINVGEDITKRLKKVDKEALKKEKLAAEPLQQKQVQAHEHKVIATKPPRRYFKENWFIENFANERLIEFAEDEVDMKQSIFIDNCNNCGILIKYKVKSIFLQKCTKIQLVFEQTVSGVEIVGSKRCEVTILNTCPSLMVDNSESVHVTFSQSKECDILSAKTMDFNITYLQADGELAKDTNLPEQFLTTWDKELNKFVTKPLENFFG